MNLKGKRFGKLYVIKRVEDKIYQNTGKHKSQWLCKCDCGNTKIILGSSLTSGVTISCGCYHKKVSSKNLNENPIYNKKYNRYDLSGEYGIGYTSDGKEFYFDLEDYDKINNICWYINNRGYVIGHNNGKQVKMHQLVFPTKNSNIVDHINTLSKNDNRKTNLRQATQQENTMNRIRPSNNTSGKKGVSFDKYTGKWVAYISFNHEHIYLGRYL